MLNASITLLLVAHVHSHHIGTMASSLYKMDEISQRARKNISSYVSHACRQDASDAPGTVKRALLLAMLNPNGAMPVGYTVWYNERRVLSVEAAELASMGRTLVARALFKAGDYIVAARGHMRTTNITQTLQEDRYTWSSAPDCGYMVSQYVEGDANLMRFVNSSKGYGQANAELVWIAGMKIPMLMAIKDLLPGDEILVDYKY